MLHASSNRLFDRLCQSQSGILGADASLLVGLDGSTSHSTEWQRPCRFHEARRGSAFLGEVPRVEKRTHAELGPEVHLHQAMDIVAASAGKDRLGLQEAANTTSGDFPVEDAC